MGVQQDIDLITPTRDFAETLTAFRKRALACAERVRDELDHRSDRVSALRRRARQRADDARDVVDERRQDLREYLRSRERRGRDDGPDPVEEDLRDAISSAHRARDRAEAHQDVVGEASRRFVDARERLKSVLSELEHFMDGEVRQTAVGFAHLSEQLEELERVALSVNIDGAVVSGRGEGGAASTRPISTNDIGDAGEYAAAWSLRARILDQMITGVRGHRMTIFDIANADEVASVKVYGALGSGGLEGALGSYLRAFEAVLGIDDHWERLRQAAADVVSGRVARDTPLPTGLRAAHDEASVHWWLRENGILRVPDDHVDAVRAHVRRAIERIPERYGLSGHRREAEVAALVGRVRGIGRVVAEIRAIAETIIGETHATIASRRGATRR